MSTLRKTETTIVEDFTEGKSPATTIIRGARPAPRQVLDIPASNDPDPIRPIVGLNAALKRVCDVAVGGLALIVLSPVLAILAIIIKLDSPGPALFCQQRRGRNGQPIKVYKFRTMHQSHSASAPDASSFAQARKNDPRVTRIGALLRKTSLDELPQLLNIVQGSMSLVGPRPHPLPLDEKFRHIIPGLEARYVVKPGLTGWAQINGFRGETNRVQDMVSRIEHDCYYISNWSLWLDLKIIAMTSVKGWVHQNAY